MDKHIQDAEIVELHSDELTVIPVEGKEGLVMVNEQQLQSLVNYAAKLQEDITTTASALKRLLTDIDVIDAFGEFQKPSYGKLISLAAKIIGEKNPQNGKLKYLIDLKPLLLEYSNIVE